MYLVGQLMNSLHSQILERYVAFNGTMIIDAEIINQPYSGEYTERIYDNQSAWNSQNWSWIKFTNEDFSEWCGHFRGSPKNVAISEKYSSVIVLTSDYLFQLDRDSGDLVEFEDQPQYQNLAASPSGDFIVADHYKIERFSSTISQKELLQSPIEMDMIKFGNWTDGKLNFTCDEFLNWDRHLKMQLNGKTFQILIKNAT